MMIAQRKDYCVQLLNEFKEENASYSRSPEKAKSRCKSEENDVDLDQLGSMKVDEIVTNIEMITELEAPYFLRAGVEFGSKTLRALG